MSALDVAQEEIAAWYAAQDPDPQKPTISRTASDRIDIETVWSFDREEVRAIAEIADRHGLDWYISGGWDGSVGIAISLPPSSEGAPPAGNGPPPPACPNCRCVVPPRGGGDL